MSAQLAALMLLLASCGPAAAPLPSPTAPAPIGRAVQAPGLKGYLVRPSQGLAPVGATLVLVTTLDDDARAAARAAATGGRLALAVGEDTDNARALAYLSGLRGAGDSPTVRCLRDPERCVIPD